MLFFTLLLAPQHGEPLENPFWELEQLGQAVKVAVGARQYCGASSNSYG